jgi:hypothetical protein
MTGDDTKTVVAWERRDDETAKQYEAFLDYLHMGPGRSLRKLLARYEAQKADKSRTNPPTTRINTLGRWSSKNDWQARLEAWVEQQAAERAARLTEHRVCIEENALEDYYFLRGKITHLMTELSNPAGEETNERISSLRTLLGLMTAADDYARRAVGLPDRISQSDVTSDGQPLASGAHINIAMQDLAELSDDELERLASGGEAGAAAPSREA